MQTSQETTNLFKAMISAFADMQAIPKDKQAYGYKYATLDNLIAMLRSVLPKHGLGFTQSFRRENGVATLTTRVFHNTGEWMEDFVEISGVDLQGKANDAQKIGAAVTYYRRYTLSAIFGIASDDDVDGNLNNIPQQQQQQQQRPKQAPAPRQEQPKQEQPKPKLDTLEYITDDWKRRIDAGEDRASIMKDYADILKTDEQRIPTEIAGEEQRVLATALFRRNNKKQ